MKAVALVITIAVLCGPLEVWASQQTAPTEVEVQALKKMAAAIPLGSRVKAQIVGGRRITGTLMSASDTAVIIKKKTRIPEPAVTIAFSELASLERDTHDGMSIAKVLGVGLAAGAGAILTLFAFIAAVED